MKVKGVNRVYIVAKDFEKAVALYSKLLGVTFNDAKVEEIFGVRCAISWEAGIELFSPLPGTTNPLAMGMLQHLEKHGEGLYGVAFGVDNADSGRDRAQEMGIAANLLEFDKETIKNHFEDKFKIFKEFVLDPQGTCGVNVTLVEIEYK
jgi:catechol 2,3-dioxygenase-like lactoylglutathione lyase family enzyme